MRVSCLPRPRWVDVCSRGGVRQRPRRSSWSHHERGGSVQRAGIAVALLLPSPLLAGAPGAPATPGDHPASHAKTRYARIRRACRLPPAGHRQCMALGRVQVAAGTAGAKPFVQDDGATESGPAGGLTPAQLASAYEYDPAEGGAGQTVALIDAYDDPKSKQTSRRSTATTGSPPVRPPTAALRRSDRPGARPRCQKPTKTAGRSRSRSTSRPPTPSASAARSCWWRRTNQPTPISRLP